MRNVRICCLLLLAGCARLPDTCTTVLPRAAYCIQGTEGIEAFSALQHVEFKGDDASGRFLVRLEVDRTAFRMALLTLLGQSLGSISYAEGLGPTIAGPGGAKQFDLLMPAAYVQLALWPREQVLKGFPARSVDVRDSDGRRVFVNGKGTTILTMEYEGKAPVYDRIIISAADGSRLIITTLERD